MKCNGIGERISSCGPTDVEGNEGSMIRADAVRATKGQRGAEPRAGGTLLMANQGPPVHAANERRPRTLLRHAGLRTTKHATPPFPFLVRPLLLLGLTVAPYLLRPANADDIADSYRLTLSPHHAIKGNLTGFGELGYRWNPENDYQAYTALWPGLNYEAARWVHFSAGLRSTYTHNMDSSDTLELRPFAGVKLLLPNESIWRIYNYTRYEFRDTQEIDTHNWTCYHRVRSQFGVEVPLTSRQEAWKPKTWYALADVEPFYRFDHDTVDPLRVGGGIGYVLNDRVHLQFIYHTQFTRPSNSGGLEYTDNIFRLNIKIGLYEGILRRLAHSHADE